MKRVSNPCNTLLVFTALVGLSVLAPRSAHSTLPALQRAAPKAHRPATDPKVSLARLPLQFEANRGQTDPRVRYLSRGPGYTLFLTDTDAVLSVTTRVKPAARKANRRSISRGIPEERAMYRRSVVKMSVAGARKGATPLGLEELPGKVNYLRGRDPRKWQQHVPTFRKVRQNGVYPGVDLVYYGNQGRLEYDFVVQPGADPRQIRLSYAGADRVEVAKDGDLVLHTGTGELRQHKPLIYQEVDGRRRLVDGRFSILAEAGAQKPAADATRSTQVAFNVAAYDATCPLVIDPELVFSTYFGCEGQDSIEAVAVDLDGNPYVTGRAATPDFPVTVGTVNETFGGSGDAYVAKLRADGAMLLYSTFVGGNAGIHEVGYSPDGSGEGTTIAVDSFGNAYVGGRTYFVDFPVVNGPQSTLGGKTDGFVAELNADGSRILYSTYLGGPGIDDVRGLALDPAANIYVTGRTPGGFPLKYPIRLNCDLDDVFVARINPALTGGASLVYSTYLGGSGQDGGSAIAVDNQGFSYVTGTTSSEDFPQKNPIPDSTTRFADSIFSAFVTKLTPTGDALVYSTYLADRSTSAHPTRTSNGFAIAVDSSGSAYVTGETTANSIATPGAAQTALPREQDSNHQNRAAFVAKLAPSGSSLVYATYLGGGQTSQSDTASGIAVDSTGIAYVTGTTGSTSFPKVDGLGAPYDTLTGHRDAFLTAVSADGRKFLYSFPFGGTNSDSGAGIALGPDHSVFLVGSTNSSEFSLLNAIHPKFGGSSDGFIARLKVPGFSTIAVTASDGAQHPFTLTGDPRANGTYSTPASVVTSTESTVVLSASNPNGAVVGGFTIDGVPTAGSFFPGGRRITLSMGQSHTVQIAYSQLPTATLTVNSSNPSSGISISLAPADKDGHQSGTTPFTSTYLQDSSSTVELTAPAAASNGSAFNRWLLDGQSAGTTNKLTVSLGASHTMTAVYVTPPSSTLTVNSSNPDSGVSINVAPKDLNSQAGGTTPFSRSYAPSMSATVTAPATAPNGNTFKNWLVDGQDAHVTSPTLSVNMSAAHTVTAVYQGSPVSIRVQSQNPASGVSIQVSGGTPATGSTTFNVSARTGVPLTLTAPATASNGNAFVRWDLPGGTTSTDRVATFTPTAAGTATAVFGAAPRNVALTVKSSNPASGVSIQVEAPTGTGTVSTTFQQSFPKGTALTLTAPGTAPGGNVFQRWQDAGGTVLTKSARLTLTVAADRTVVAVYGPPANPVTLTVSSANPASGVKVDGVVNGSSFSSVTSFTRPASVGAAVELTTQATAPNGNVFVKWQRDGVDVTGGTSVHISFTLDTSRTYTAVYGPPGPQQATLTVNAINTSGASVRVQTGATDTVLTTPFQQRLATGSQVTLTAAATAPPPTTAARRKPRSLTPNTEFQKWLRDNKEFSGNTSQSITFTLDADHTYTAVYAYVLNVTTSGTAQNVPITVTPTDRNGNAVGNAPFTRVYDPGVSVTLTAPATLSNGDQFARWSIDGQFQPAGQRSITVRMDINRFVQASYSAASPSANRTVPSATPGGAAKVRVQAGGVTIVEVPAFRKSYPLGTQVTLPARHERVPGVPGGTVRTPRPPSLSSSGWGTAGSPRATPAEVSRVHPERGPRLRGGVPV